MIIVHEERGNGVGQGVRTVSLQMLNSIDMVWLKRSEKSPNIRGERVAGCLVRENKISSLGGRGGQKFELICTYLSCSDPNAWNMAGSERENIDRNRQTSC